jgi:hypothetical protein
MLKSVVFNSRYKSINENRCMPLEKRKAAAHLQEENNSNGIIIQIKQLYELNPFVEHLLAA